MKNRGVQVLRELPFKLLFEVLQEGVLQRAVDAVAIHHLPIGGRMYPAIRTSIDVRVAMRGWGIRGRGNGGRQGRRGVTGRGGSGERTANLKLLVGFPDVDRNGRVVTCVVDVGDVSLVLRGGREHAGFSWESSCPTTGECRRVCTEGDRETRPMSLKAKGEVSKLPPRSSSSLT